MICSISVSVHLKCFLIYNFLTNLFTYWLLSWLFTYWLLRLCCLVSMYLWIFQFSSYYLYIYIYISLTHLFIYLFIWWALGLSCGTQDLRCAMWDLSLGLTDSLVVAQWLQSTRAQLCGAQAQLLHGMWDLSFPARDWTCVPCIARWILNHCSTREVPLPVTDL